jgi:hypothetical protein
MMKDKYNNFCYEDPPEGSEPDKFIPYAILN